MSHVQLKIMDFVGQQKGVGHKAIVVWEKPLQATDNDAKDVFLGKVLLTKVNKLVVKHLHP